MGAVPRTAYPADRDGDRAEAEIHRIHDRYLVEVVEGLGLCPFARRSREMSRVHRPLLWVDGRGPTPRDAAQALLDVASEHDDAEIVLLTFVDPWKRFATAAQLDAFVAKVRDAYAQTDGRLFFMVGFHPDPGSGTSESQARPLTKDSLVTLLRRSPDPVIQCVDAQVLERVRRQAQQAAHRRLLDQLGKRDPVLRTLVEKSVQADSELSADIARTNFETVGGGSGRDELERRLTEIRADRDRTYATLGLLDRVQAR